VGDFKRAEGFDDELGHGVMVADGAPGGRYNAGLCVWICSRWFWR
jgi:hypothetical protein